MLRAVWNRLPPDVVALCAIAVAVVAIHRPFLLHGMCFNDPSWYFHFGHRALIAGEVPYRDYVFQVGPLPIYVDAAFQGLFGSKYAASLYAALFIRVLRVWGVWMIVRRVADRRTATAFGVFCAIDPLFGFAHHWGTAYAQLCIIISALFVVIANRHEGRAALRYLVLAGVFAGLVIASRQSSAIMIGVVLLAATTVMLARKQLPLAHYIALWTGFASALVVFAGALAAAGALGPAIQQLFLDAPAKKGVSGVAAVLDAVSGGALVISDRSWWGGFLSYLAIPSLIVTSVMVLASRPREFAIRTLGLLVLPVAFVLGLLVRYSEIHYFTDLPRVFFTTTSAIAVLFPARCKAWFGVDPMVALGIGALPLACDWALEMSYPGRGWGDAPSLATGVFLFAFASSRLPISAKRWMAVAVAVAALVNFLFLVRSDVNPIAKDTAGDGQWSEQSFQSRHRRLRGLAVTESRKAALDWLTWAVPARSTCFVYGNMPVLYTLLRCTNHTRLDSTAADFITAADAEAALAVLRASPPDYLVAHESGWMSPPLTLDLPPTLAAYGGLNPAASMVMHRGLRALLSQYQDLGRVADQLPPHLVKQASLQWDTIEATRVYRRKAALDLRVGQ